MVSLSERGRRVAEKIFEIEGIMREREAIDEYSSMEAHLVPSDAKASPRDRRAGGEDDEEDLSEGEDASRAPGGSSREV